MIFKTFWSYSQVYFLKTKYCRGDRKCGVEISLRFQAEKQTKMAEHERNTSEETEGRTRDKAGQQARVMF